MTTPSIEATLAEALARLAPGPIAIACSGGMDSSVLLHALAASASARARGLRVIHVDHALHADSAHWAAHCAATAAALGLGIDIRRVDVDRSRGTGIEDAARAARMAAFASALARGEFLALAQHRDDQAETVLLKLLRGAGPEGLAGMRELRACGTGQLWRPLLGLPRAVLHDYATAHAMRWVEDPSNAQTRIERNFLRSEILPRLRERWHEVEKPLAHSAQWLRASADFIDDEASKAFARMQGVDPSTLAWRDWLALPDALRDPVLRRWLRELALDEPAHIHVIELARQLRGASTDRLPCIAFAGTELRRYRDLLYAMRKRSRLSPDWRADWTGAALPLPAGGELRAQPTCDFDPPLRVTYRSGGERIKPAGGAHTRDLRLLLQEAGVPPWQRDSIPFVYLGDELLAVGDLVLSDAGKDYCAERDCHFLWSPDVRSPTAAA